MFFRAMAPTLIPMKVILQSCKIFFTIFWNHLPAICILCFSFADNADICLPLSVGRQIVLTFLFARLALFVKRINAISLTLVAESYFSRAKVLSIIISCTGSAQKWSSSSASQSNDDVMLCSTNKTECLSNWNSTFSLIIHLIF